LVSLTLKDTIDSTTTDSGVNTPQVTADECSTVLLEHENEQQQHSESRDVAIDLNTTDSVGVNKLPVLTGECSTVAATEAEQNISEGREFYLLLLVLYIN
jgi:hypothetical protein